MAPTSAMLMTGDFTGTMGFGADVLVNTGVHQAGFIAKIDAACHPVWARSLPSPSADVAIPSVALDGDRAVVAGSFAGSVDVGGTMVSAVAGDGKDAFVAVFDGTGQRVAVLHLGGAGTQAANAIAVANGAPVVVGTFSTEVRVDSSGADAGSPLLPGTTAPSGFAVKLASSGDALTPVWATAFAITGTLSGQGAQAVDIDRSGNVFVTGVFSGTLTFGAGACAPITSAAGAGTFVAKLDPNGACAWARGFAADITTGIAVDSKGDAVVTGSFKGTVNLGDRSWTASADNHNAMLLKLSGADGATRWSLGFGDAEEQHGMDVRIGADDSIYVTLDFTGGADFDPSRDGGDVQSVGGADVLVAKYDASGGFVWVRRYGDAGEQRSKRVGIDVAGAVTVAGELGGGKLGDDPNAISGDTRKNVFVMRLAP